MSPSNEDDHEQSRQPSPGFEPFARFPLRRMGPEWFGPNWLTGTDWFGHWDELFPTRWPVPYPPPPQRDLLRIEEHDEEDAHVIRAEMPGLDPETDITVEIDGDLLTIAATREQRSESRGELIRTEFRYGTFRRTVRLPTGTAADDVSATYDAGVLEVRIARRRDPSAAVTIPVRRPGPPD